MIITDREDTITHLYGHGLSQNNGQKAVVSTAGTPGHSHLVKYTSTCAKDDAKFNKESPS